MHRTGNHPADYACPMFHIDDVPASNPAGVFWKINRKIVWFLAESKGKALWTILQLSCIVLDLYFGFWFIWLYLPCIPSHFPHSCSKRRKRHSRRTLCYGSGHFVNWLHLHLVENMWKIHDDSWAQTTDCHIGFNQFRWLSYAKLQLC